MSLSKMVARLYRRLGLWQVVADACNDDKLFHSPGYYQQVATGRIKQPNLEAATAIEVAAQKYLVGAEMPLKRERVPRYGITIRYELGSELNRLRGEMTWDEFFKKMQQMLGNEVAG